MTRRELPDAVAARLSAFGDAGIAWGARFGAVLEATAQRWSLEVGAPFAGLSYNFVAPATRGRVRCVLKLGVPSAELRSEIAALSAFDGRGAVRLLEADAGAGALLLERVEPGTRLAELADDDRATAIACDAMTTLWRPAEPGHAFRSVRDWSRALRTMPPHALPSGLLDHAIEVFETKSDGETLLHGDLHHFNLLAGQGGGWVAIDPKGAVGHPGYEFAPLLRNRLFKCEDPTRRLERRIARIARHLRLDEKQVLSWCLAGNVLSAAWSFKEGTANDQALACARLALTLTRQA